MGFRKDGEECKREDLARTIILGYFRNNSLFYGTFFLCYAIFLNGMR